jgi:predicted DNA-binding transcriptional regulator AlpA
MMTAESSAAEVGLSLPAFWRAVAAGRLPAPLYPAPRAPRWRRSELLGALEATRALPAEAKAARRAARLAADRGRAA